jgi:hypothetical protein
MHAGYSGLVWLGYPPYIRNPAGLKTAWKPSQLSQGSCILSENQQASLAMKFSSLSNNQDSLPILFLFPKYLL